MLAAEDGRWDRNARNDEHVRYCVSCWNAREARGLRAKLGKGPRKVIDDEQRVSYAACSPWENPLAYLQTYGIVGNDWAAWMAQRGLLDDYFDRPVCAQDFGDEASREKAEQMGVLIDDREHMR